MSPLEMARLGLRPVRVLSILYRLRSYRVQDMSGWRDWLRALGDWQPSADGGKSAMLSWAPTGLAPPAVPQLIARK
jgi:hypothetical protein